MWCTSRIQIAQSPSPARFRFRVLSDSGSGGARYLDRLRPSTRLSIIDIMEFRLLGIQDLIRDRIPSGTDTISGYDGFSVEVRLDGPTRIGEMVSLPPQMVRLSKSDVDGFSRGR